MLILRPVSGSNNFLLIVIYYILMVIALRNFTITSPLLGKLKVLR